MTVYVETNSFIKGDDVTFYKKSSSRHKPSRFKMNTDIFLPFNQLAYNRIYGNDRQGFELKSYLEPMQFPIRKIKLIALSELQNSQNSRGKFKYLTMVSDEPLSKKEIETFRLNFQIFC